MRVQCPHCQTAGTIRDDYESNKLKCPKCSQVFALNQAKNLDWHFVQGETQMGPVPQQQFDSLVQDGTITKDTLVWNSEMTDWKPLSEVRASIPASTATAGQAVCSECGRTFPESEMIQHGNASICAGCKPVFLQKLQEGAISAEGGTLENGINGNYDFAIMAVLKEAWAKTKGAKASVFGGWVVISVIIFSAAFLLKILMGAGLISVDKSGIVAGITAQLAITCISYPMTVGLVMIGIRRAVNRPVSFSMVFNYFPFTLYLVVAGILSSLTIFAGTLFLIIPGIYLSLAYIFTMPLIVEKGLGPWRAMEASRKAVTHHWFKVFGVYFFMMSVPAIMGIISAILVPSLAHLQKEYLLIPAGFLGIMSIVFVFWGVPMFINAGGIMYRIMFGVESKS